MGPGSCRGCGTRWRGHMDENSVLQWALSYSNPSLVFVGVGLADSAVVAIVYNSKRVVRSTDLTGGPWIVDQVFEKNLLPWGCYSDHPSQLWVATYETKPRYSSDGGVTWTQTSGAAGNAISGICKFNGTLMACGPGGVWRSDDDGVTWTTVIDSAPGYVGAVGGGPAGWLVLFPLARFLTYFRRAIYPSQSQNSSTKEAAERLGVTPQAVGNYIRGGDLPATKRSKGRDWQWIIQLSDLEGLAKTHSITLRTEAQ